MARFFFLPRQGAGLGGLGQVSLTARPLDLLDHESPARGGFQGECRLVALQPGEPTTQPLAGGGPYLAGFHLAGVDLYVVEGDLLPMHVESAYNLHPWGLLKLRLADIIAVILSALELRTSLFISSFYLASLVGHLSHHVRMFAPDDTRRELRRTSIPRSRVDRYCWRLLLELRLCPTILQGGAHLADSRDPA